MQLKDQANGVLLELNSIKSERRVERMLNSDQGLQKLEEFNKMIKAEKDQKEALGAEIKKFQIEISELKTIIGNQAHTIDENLIKQNGLESELGSIYPVVSYNINIFL